MKTDRKRLLRILAEGVDGTNEAMLEQLGFRVSCLDRAAADGVVLAAPRTYHPPGLKHVYPNGLTVRRFYITPAGHAALARERKAAP
jgi:hypothetical protein